jgi:hypothetical protein
MFIPTIVGHLRKWYYRCSTQKNNFTMFFNKYITDTIEYDFYMFRPFSAIFRQIFDKEKQNIGKARLAENTASLFFLKGQITWN